MGRFLQWRLAVKNTNFMRKFAVILMSLMTFAFAANADDSPIDYAQLPAAAKSFISTELPGETVSFVTKDAEMHGSTYDVVFASGLKVEFDGQGEWKEISGKRSQINKKFVPKEIVSQVESRWPNTGFTKIDRDRRGYEVELTNGLDLKFNKKFKLVEIDD